MARHPGADPEEVATLCWNKSKWFVGGVTDMRADPEWRRELAAAHMARHPGADPEEVAALCQIKSKWFVGGVTGGPIDVRADPEWRRELAAAHMARHPDADPEMVVTLCQTKSKWFIGGVTDTRADPEWRRELAAACMARHPTPTQRWWPPSTRPRANGSSGASPTCGPIQSGATSSRWPTWCGTRTPTQMRSKSCIRLKASKPSPARQMRP